ncbi:MAG: gliding motility-associated C-terminal domain-containing protein [Cytophagaceae bacterium]
MRIRFTILIVFLLGYYSLSAQTDTEFWFAAPEVTNQHADQPIYLRISSLNKAATVTISQPATPGFPPIVRNIPANSSASVNLSPYIDFLENDNFNFVEKKGLYIKSTSEITAYYEVYGSTGWGPVNTDIFVLKGRNALGTDFYTPFQTYWDNNTSVNGWSSIDVVATENGTQVTITPSQDLVGHPKNIPFTVSLNKGETFSGRAASGYSKSHPAGSHITSNKPIAVTIKDDSILEGPNYDLAGDQIIPVSLTGKEYVVIKSSTGTINDDRVFICATQNNTDIFIDGNPVPDTTLSAGGTFSYQVTNPASYITTSQNVYVFHMAGLNGELAGALLPALACTGSREVRFTRNVTNDQFNATLKLNIIVKAGKEGYFKLNGNTSNIPASSFTAVPGSGGTWMTAQIYASFLMIPEGSVAVITNDSSDFHLGVTSGVINKSFEYGYFSDYGSLDLGVDRFFCKGDSTELDAGIMDSYVWSKSGLSIGTAESITVSDSGQYFIKTTKGLCTFYDTVNVYYNPDITHTILGPDTTMCAGLDYTIKTDTIFSSYQWQNGSKSATLKPSSGGIYSVKVSNVYGCTKSDSILVTINPNPTPHIINAKETEGFCKDSSVTLDAGAGYVKYLWMNGDSTEVYSGRHINEDKYWVTVTDLNGCTGTDTLELDCSVFIEFPNLITPNGDSLNEVFFVKALKPGKWSLEVFNRWGDRVYFNKSYDNTWNGKNDHDGLYYFHLKHVKGKVNYKSWVEIIRDSVISQ